jgi:hypothetical protein
MVVLVGVSAPFVVSTRRRKKIVKAFCMGVLCAAVVAAGAWAAPAGELGYLTHLNLTCMTTNGATIVKTKITDKDIVAQCASDESVDPARLRLLFVVGDLAVVDIVTSNVTCEVATMNGDTPTNVIVGVYVGATSNKVKVVSFSLFNSLGGSSLVPADMAGTMVATSGGTVGGRALSNVTLKATIQAGSVTNNAVYTGTMSIGGKPFTVVLPP